MKNIIEINGRKYNAQTGELIYSGSTAKPKHLTSNPNQLIDGVKKPAGRNKNKAFAATRPTAKQAIAKPARSTHPNTAPIIGDMQSSASPAVKNRIKKSLTLSRAVVSKPLKKAAFIKSKSTPRPGQYRPHQNSNPGLDGLDRKIPDARVNRAINQAKSNVISRFSKQSSVNTVLSPNLTVKQQPTSQPMEQNNLPETPSVFSQNTTRKNKNTRVSHSDEAAQNTTQKASKKFSFSKKLAGFSTAGLALIVLGGFMAYQRVPELAIKVATNTAQFSIKAPHATPGGYAFKGPIKAAKYSAVMTYKSNSDSRYYTLTQKPTDWTSESLLSNFLVNAKYSYQTYYDKGLTIFVYNKNNATWVDKGVWFTLQSDGTLSNDQILSIASSI